MTISAGGPATLIAVAYFDISVHGLYAMRGIIDRRFSWGDEGARQPPVTNMIYLRDGGLTPSRQHLSGYRGGSSLRAGATHG